MSITRTAPSDHQIVDSIVVFALDLWSRVKNVVTQGVEFSKVDSDVG